MSERPDLPSLLRALDEQYAAVTPRADLEARLLSRIRGEAPSPRPLARREARRYARPLILAFAASAALVILASGERPPSAPEAIALEPNATEEVRPEKIRADGGLPEQAPNAGPSRRSPRISAPGLWPPPAWLEDKAPFSARPRSTPRSAPWIPQSVPGPAESPSWPLFEEDRSAPAPRPAEPRPVGPKSTPPPGASLMFPLPAPAQGAAPSPTAPQSQLHVPSLPSHPSSDPPVESVPTATPDTTPTPDGAEECKSPETLGREVVQACLSQGVSALVYFLDPCGDGRFLGSEGRCEDIKTPEPDPPGCEKSKLSTNDQSCQDPASFNAPAAVRCNAAGLELFRLYYDFNSQCPVGLVNLVSMTCCPEPGTPAPCVDGKSGDAKTCQDQSALVAQAQDACRQAGRSLTAYKTSSDCAGSQSTTIFYSCCEKAP